MPPSISYETIIQNLSEAVLILDANQQIISVNQAFLDLFQSEKNKLLGYPLSQIFPPLAQLISDTKVSKIVTIYGRELYYQLSPLYENGGLQGFLLQLDESQNVKHLARVTQLDTLRVVDDEVSRTLDIKQVLTLSLDAAILLSGADGGFIALNTGEPIEITHVTGSYLDIAIGASLYPDVGIVGRVLRTHEPQLVLDVFSDPDYYVDIPETQALMALPLIVQDRLVGILNLETTDPTRFTESTFQFIRLLAGRLAVALQNARLYDIVRKQLEELYILYEELRHAEDLKTDMIRIANHDLKNPLSIIRGYIDLMEMDSDQLPEDYNDAIPTMRRSLDRAYNILDEFLSLEAINERTSGKKSRKFDFRELIEKATEEFRPQITKKHHTLTISLPDDKTLIKGDRAQLYEAVANILHNAIKYTPNGGNIHVEIRITNTQDAQFTVSDNGYGIPEKDQPNLFKPFYRSDSAEISGIEGSGLGLHLVKNIVERHRGEMIVNSVYQQGSTFGFLLPLAPG
jgi:signal transduction histidine kinase